MSYTITGKIHQIGDVVEVGQNKFQKREFVIESDERYPQMIKFELMRDNCDYVDGKNVGDVIKVHFNLKGSTWNDKYFVNLIAWKIENQSDNKSVKQPSQNTPEDAPFPELPEGGEDDLPF